MKKEGIIIIVVIIIAVVVYFLFFNKRRVPIIAPQYAPAPVENNQGKLIDLGGALLNKILPDKSASEDGSFDSYFDERP